MYELVDGTALHVARTAMGFACKVKKTTRQKKYTTAHLPYWEAPVPPRATFSVRTLLSQWDIRPWYSNAVNTFENAIKRQRRRAISEEEASADHPSDDDEPDGED